MFKICEFQRGDKSLVMNIKKHVEKKTHNNNKNEEIFLPLTSWNLTPI